MITLADAISWSRTVARVVGGSPWALLQTQLRNISPGELAGDDPAREPSPARREQIQRHARRRRKNERRLEREQKDHKAAPPDDDEPLEALVAPWGSMAGALEALGDDDEDVFGEDEDMTEEQIMEQAMTGLDARGRAQFLALQKENKLRAFLDGAEQPRISPDDAAAQGRMLQAMTMGLSERDANEVRASFARTLRGR